MMILFEGFLEKTWIAQLSILGGIFYARAFLLAGGATLWIRFSSWAKSRTVVKEGHDVNIFTDILHGCFVLAIDAVVTVAAIKTGLVKTFVHGTSAQYWTAFAIFFVWLEIYFYYSHRVLHLPRFYWIHKHHHHARATNPWTSLSFSFAERMVLLFGSIVIPGIVSQFIPFSLEAFSTYFLLNYILNVAAHLNVEVVPNRFLKTWPGKVIITTTFHALHHARYRGHYGLYTQTLDRLHGTRFADYEAVHLQTVTKP